MTGTGPLLPDGRTIYDRTRNYREGLVMVTKNKRLVAVSDEEELDRLVLAHTPRFIALLDAAQDRIKKSGGLSHKDFWNAAEKEKKDRRTSR